MSADFLREHIFIYVDIPFKKLFKRVLFAAMLTSVDETLKSINASAFGMKSMKKRTLTVTRSLYKTPVLGYRILPVAK